MKIAILFMLALTGCASAPAGKFSPGDVVEARHFSRHPQYNGTPVVVRSLLKWTWVRELQGNAMRVYEIETVDGERLAAQEFQLKGVSHE